MLDAARRLSPRPVLLVSAGRPESRAFIERHAEGATIVDFGTAEILRGSDVALITSGSASMEAVFYDCPAVVLYRLSPLSYFFARPHIRCAIAQPNLIAGRGIVPEFLLPTRSGRRVAKAAQLLLDDASARDAQRREFAAIRERLLLGRKPSEAAADVVLGYARAQGGSGAR
jgi:lipid A disaccharide synthetase